jgi:hypothetical protein
LHERVRHQNEVAGKPAARRHGHGGKKMVARPQTPLAPDQRADKCALQKERKHPFHRQRLPDHASRKTREVGPVRAELKFHRNARHHAHGKIQTENSRPKTQGLIVLFVTRAQGHPLPPHQKPREPHGELRKEIMVRDCESELESAPKSGIGNRRIHRVHLFCRKNARDSKASTLPLANKSPVLSQFQSLSAMKPD